LIVRSLATPSDNFTFIIDAGALRNQPLDFLIAANESEEM